MSQSLGETPIEPGAPLPEDSRQDAKVNFPVFLGSSAGILAIALWALISPTTAAEVLGVAVGAISKWFGWFYIALAAIILVFVFSWGSPAMGKPAWDRLTRVPNFLLSPGLPCCLPPGLVPIFYFSP